LVGNRSARQRAEIVLRRGKTNLPEEAPSEGTRPKYMTDRIQFIVHEGKQILLVDLSNSSAAEVEKTLRALPDVVTTCPRNSVLALTDFTGPTPSGVNQQN
jgi:hypothetical protein